MTASFHGVVFCILFHKKFLCTPLMGEWNGTLVPKGGNDRILDLLNKLDLNSCIYDRTLPFHNYVDIDIDWDIVDDRLNRYRNISNDFLSRNLC